MSRSVTLLLLFASLGATDIQVRPKKIKYFFAKR